MTNEEERLQKLHDDGGKVESEGHRADWSTVIYRSFLDNDEKKAFDAGVENVREQRRGN